MDFGDLLKLAPVVGAGLYVASRVAQQRCVVRLVESSCKMRRAHSSRTLLRAPWLGWLAKEHSLGRGVRGIATHSKRIAPCSTEIIKRDSSLQTTISVQTEAWPQ